MKDLEIIRGAGNLLGAETKWFSSMKWALKPIKIDAGSLGRITKQKMIPRFILKMKTIERNYSNLQKR